MSDNESGEKLINANVYNPLDFKGAVTNPYGFYSLTLPQGKYTIKYSYVGYTPQEITIELNADKTINIDLSTAKLIEEVTVIGTGVEDKLQSTQMSRDVINMETVKTLPAFMGEADVIKTLQLLPGVQSGTEGSSGLYVRGGGPDQNLILLDGVPVYNANHLFGFFSVFNPDAIKNVTLYKGGFPARYGGRLSSVVDVRMKEGNEKEFHGGYQIGLISSKLFLEGPIIKDKTAFSFSARRTYADLLMRPFQNKKKGIFGYYFYDLNAKVNHKFSDKSRLFLSAYTGKDKAYYFNEQTYMSNDYTEPSNTTKSKDINESDLYWQNLTTSLRWNYIFNNKLFSNTTLIYSNYNFNIGEDNKTYKDSELTDQNSYLYSSGINDIGLKVDFDYYPIQNHNVKFGGKYLYHTFNPGIETSKFKFEEEKNTDNIEIGENKKYAHEAYAFIEDEIALFSNLKLNAGLHYSTFNVNSTSYSSLEPRVSARYLISDKLTAKAAYSKMQQYLHLLSNSTIGLPTDLWLPTTEKVKPQASEQYAAGLFYSPKGKFTISAEGFYKTMDNLIEYKPGASFFSSSESWENKIYAGEGRSYGLELLARKEVGKTTGWIGYTWSKTERLFNRENNVLNYGNWYPARYDRRHDISIVLTHKPSDRIDFGVTWVYSTGNALTLAGNRIQTLETNSNTNYWYSSTVDYFEERNNYRMPAYHRLDFGINFHKQKKRGIRTWNISIYNVYNRKNPFFLDTTTNKETNSLTLKQISLFPILPSISYSYKF